MSTRVVVRTSVLALLLATSARAQSSFERGIEAYRRGAYAEARERWQAALAEDLGRLARARVYYDLGNASWRLEQPLEAIACYTAALRLDPGHSDARKNLELARAKAGLAPADPGDLRATLERVLTSLPSGERRLLVLAALLSWAVLLGLEVRFGGAAPRNLLFAGSLCVVLAAVPWLRGVLHRGPAAPMLVIQAGTVTVRSEPLEGRAALGELAALDEVARLDALPGWVLIERADGLCGWVREEALLPLVLETPHTPPTKE